MSQYVCLVIGFTRYAQSRLRSVAEGPAGMLIAEATAVAISADVNVGEVPGWPVNVLVEIKFQSK